MSNIFMADLFILKKVYGILCCTTYLMSVILSRKKIPIATTFSRMVFCCFNFNFQDFFVLNLYLENFQSFRQNSNFDVYKQRTVSSVIFIYAFICEEFLFLQQENQFLILINDTWLYLYTEKPIFFIVSFILNNHLYRNFLQ